METMDFKEVDDAACTIQLNTPKQEIAPDERLSKFVLINQGIDNENGNGGGGGDSGGLGDGGASFVMHPMVDTDTDTKACEDSLENVLSHTSQNQDKLSDNSDDTGKTLEPKPISIVRFFGLRRRSGSFSPNSSSGTGKEYLRTPPAAFVNTDAHAGIDDGDADGKKTSNAAGSGIGSSSSFSRLTKKWMPSRDSRLVSPWYNFKSAIWKRKFNIYDPQKAMQDLKLDDDSRSGSEGSVKIHEDPNESEQDHGTTNFKDSLTEVELESREELQDVEAIESVEIGSNIQNNDATLEVAMAEERILVLPYRAGKKALKTEMIQEIGNCKREAKLTESQLKGKLRQDEKHLKGNIALQIKESKDLTKRRVRIVKTTSKAKISTFKEHHLGGKCREIMAKYRTDKARLDLTHKAEIQRLQQGLEIKLLELEMKKEGKERMLRQNLMKEMGDVVGQIRLVKSELHAAGNNEDQELDSLLADASSLLAHETSV